MKVMLVAADPVLPELLRRPLVPLGHSLTVVASAAELQELLPEVKPRAVILPRRLPDAELPDVVAWLRGQLEDIAIGTVIIGLEPRDREVARAVHADGFLLAPFADREVLDVLGAARGRASSSCWPTTRRSSTATPCPSSRRPATTW